MDSISFVTASQGTTWITASGTTWFSAVEFVSSHDSNSISTHSSRTSVLSTVTTLLQPRSSPTAVHRIVRNGNEEKLRKLLKYHPDLSIRDKDQKTALQWAFELDNQTMVTLLLDADPNLALLVPSEDYPQTSPLQYAVENNDLKTVKVLLERGADPSLQPYPLKEAPLHLAILKNKNQMLEVLLTAASNPSALSTISHETPLHVAVRLRNVRVVKLLLDAGSDPSALSMLSQTPLHLAAQLKHEMMITMLLNAGSDISARDQAGKTPFVIAFSEENTPLAVLRMLLDAGAEINEPGLLPLHQTIRSSWKTESDNSQDSERCLQLFIDSKADVTAVDKDGLSPLHLAVASLQNNMVQILIAAGANVSAKAPERGWAPLHYLALYPSSECWFPIKGWSDSDPLWYYTPSIRRDPVGSADKRRVILALLLKAGADASIKLSSGETPLHFAAHQGCTETLKALLDAGADPTVRDQYGNTLLHFAFWKHGPKLSSLMKVLPDAGRDISAQNSLGQTPLCWATMEPWRRPQIVELLQEAGVDVTAQLQAWHTHDLVEAQKPPQVWESHKYC
jgi:uncharacterized protein